MSQASYAVGAFLGGELSQFAQGRWDKPDYRISLKVCLNGFPNEIGTWIRRPGTHFAGTPRGGAQAKILKFDFNQFSPYSVELTAGFMRFRTGTALATTNDPQVVLAISSANPAVVQTTTATTWLTGDTLVFGSLGSTAPLLLNRQFTATKVDTTHFSLKDAITGANIDGSALGAISASATVSRIHELTTPYVVGDLSTIRGVQAETTTVLLTANVAPQLLTVSTLPVPGFSAQFAINPAAFLDGPYLDLPVGALATPTAVSGITTLTLSFQAYSSSKAYSKGDFVTSSAVGYQSLQDANVGNTPASSPTFWKVASPGLAAGPNGIQTSDIGRHIRLWQAAIVTWGKITGLSSTGFVDVSALGSIGDLTGNDGLAAIFDGTLRKIAQHCGIFTQTFAGGGGNVHIDLFAGKSFASPQAINYIYLTPSTDLNLVFVQNAFSISNIVCYLRGSNSPPATPDAGTALGNATAAYGSNSPILITSNDTVTTWNYIWVEIVFDVTGFGGVVVDVCVSQIQYYGASANSAGTVFNVEILGVALGDLSATAWQLGAYSNTTGWPTCGAYYEGRLWLGGAIDNRFDASVSNGITASSINFAPTSSAGVVAASNAINYTLNSDGVNPIFWMQPDLQGLIMGTQAGEWLVVAPTTGPIAPANIAARRVTKIGCANIEPRRTEHTTIFVKRYARKLMEYFADVYSGKFTAPNIADKAEHIPRTGIAELAYTEAVTPVIWGRCADGSLFGVTYKRDTLTTSQGPTYAGWHRHTLGSGRTVESIRSGPSVGGDLDSLTMVTNDTATGIRHVEVLTDTMDEFSALADSWFLDDAITITSSSSTSSGGAYGQGALTINGLWHLNGKTVQVFAGGLDCGDPGEGKAFSDFVVSNGSVVVPYGDGISAGPGRGRFTAAFAATATIIVGFTYTSDGQLVRPILQADTGARNGPAFAKLSRGHRYGMKLVNTLGLSVGGDLAKTMYPANFKTADGVTNIAVLTTFTGIHADSLRDDYGYDNAPCWRISRPFPANIVAVGSNLSTQDQ